MIEYRSKRAGNQGFSLVELSTALFIVTVGTFGVLTMFFYGLDKVRATNDSRVAVRALENEIEARRALPFNQLQEGAAPFVSKTPETERLHDPIMTVAIGDAGGDRLREVTASIVWGGENGRRIEKHISVLIAYRGP